MRISSEHRYPAGVDRLFVVLGEEAFHQQVCRSTGAVDFAVELLPDAGGGGLTIRIERAMPTDQVPEFVRSMVGPTLRISEVHRWESAAPDGTRPGQVTVQVQGAPVRFAATLRLSPDGPGCLHRVEGDLTASIPFLGSRVAKAAEPAVRAAIDAQFAIAESWISR